MAPVAPASRSALTDPGSWPYLGPDQALQIGTPGPRLHVHSRSKQPLLTQAPGWVLWIQTPRLPQNQAGTHGPICWAYPRGPQNLIGLLGPRVKALLRTPIPDPSI